VRINGTFDATKTINEQSTLVFDWQIMSHEDGLILNNTQGLRLAYDNTVLQLMSWDGSDTIVDTNINTSYTAVANAGIVGAYGDNLSVYSTTDESGKLGFVNISLGDPFETYDCIPGENLLLAQIRFAFRAGKTLDDLNADSIRCQNISELDATAQSSAILLNTDDDYAASYEYLRQSNGTALGGDKLNAPTITYPGNEISTEVPSELSTSVPEAPDQTIPNESVVQDITDSQTTATEKTGAGDSLLVDVPLSANESSFPDESAFLTEAVDADRAHLSSNEYGVNVQESNEL